jgi:hypothetical protein
LNDSILIETEFSQNFCVEKIIHHIIQTSLNRVELNSSFQMKINKTSFDPKQVLPNNLILKSAATHLYTTGLSLYPYEFAQRNRYDNPLLVFILNLQQLIRCIFSLLLSDENKYLLMILGDWSHLFNVRIHTNILACLVILIALVSQIIHYYNFKNNIKPSYLKPCPLTKYDQTLCINRDLKIKTNDGI